MIRESPAGAIEYNDRTFERIDALITSNSADLRAIERERLLSFRNLNYLYLNDQISPAELSGFLKLHRSTIYRKFSPKAKGYGGCMLADEREGVRLAPKDVFNSLEEYEDFLQWRTAGSKDETVTIKAAATILCLTEYEIRKEIREGKLLAVKCNGNKYEIFKSSFLLYAMDIKKRDEQRINSIDKYLNATTKLKI